VVERYFLPYVISYDFFPGFTLTRRRRVYQGKLGNTAKSTKQLHVCGHGQLDYIFIHHVNELSSLMRLRLIN
jgi:hypothetical protein